MSVPAAKARTEILISGFGGQGVIRMGQILGLAAIKQGHRVTMLKSHGTETRGGYVRAQIVIAPEYVDSPVVENADVFVAFSAPAYKKFLKLMGAPADRVFLFPPNTHDQIAITALAMEKAKSPMAADWSKQIIAVGNGPGQELDDVVEALKLVRAGKPVNFQGAGSTCDFTPNGDQLGRGMGQWIIKNGKSEFVEYAKP